MDRNLLENALRYAKIGIPVFPLHSPTENGCSCEAHKRSEKYKAWLKRQGKEEKFNPNYQCKEANRGKHPRISNWKEKATTNEKQIIEWWTKWPDANIAGYLGPAGYIAIDLDEYKNDFDAQDILSFSERQTWTQITGGGGEHLIYRKPNGSKYGNDNSSMPNGVDIRSDNGYIVLAPSIHRSGRQYEWEEGYSPFDSEPLDLPESIVNLLNEISEHDKDHGMPLRTSQKPQEGLNLPTLPKVLIERINASTDVGSRSEYDFAAVIGLVKAGLSDEEIFHVFSNYPIGTEGKFADHVSPDKYLEATIRNARLVVKKNTGAEKNIKGTVFSWRQIRKTSDFSELVPVEYHAQLRNGGTSYRTGETDRAVMDAILDLCEQHNTLKVYTSSRLLAKATGLGTETCRKSLQRLQGWFADIEVTHEGTIILISESSLLLNETLNSHNNCVLSDSSSNNEKSKYATMRNDDAFASGISKSKIIQAKELVKIIGEEVIRDIAVKHGIETERYLQSKGDVVPYPAYLLAAKLYFLKPLGKRGLRVIEALSENGSMTAKELSDSLGTSYYSIRTTLKQLFDSELLNRDGAGNRQSPYVYSLVGNVQDRIDELRPNMQTAFISLEREEKRLFQSKKYILGVISMTNDEQKKGQLESRLAKVEQNLEEIMTKLGRKDAEIVAHDRPRSVEIPYEKLMKMSIDGKDRIDDEIYHLVEKFNERPIADLIDVMEEVGFTTGDIRQATLLYKTMSMSIM